LDKLEEVVKDRVGAVVEQSCDLDKLKAGLVDVLTEVLEEALNKLEEVVENKVGAVVEQSGGVFTAFGQRLTVLTEIFWN
jgi:hypothetical protein